MFRKWQRGREKERAWAVRDLLSLTSRETTKELKVERKIIN